MVSPFMDIEIRRSNLLDNDNLVLNAQPKENLVVVHLLLRKLAASEKQHQLQLADFCLSLALPIQSAE